MKLEWKPAFLLTVILIGVIFFAGCKKAGVSEENNGTLDQEVEQKIMDTVCYCGFTTANLADQFLDRALKSLQDGIPIELGEYVDGWWFFENITLKDNQKAQGSVQLLDNNGLPQKEFNENSTAKIIMIATVTREDSNSTDVINIENMELSQVNEQGKPLLVSYTGNLKFQKLDSEFASYDLAFQKDVSEGNWSIDDSMPESGGMVLQMPDAKVTVTYNGSTTVNLEIQFQGETYQRTVSIFRCIQDPRRVNNR
ncbi:MAG: hypothetical protein GY757_56660 [bacterium]|nr:hypothetical protein [bacterium]